MIKEIAKYIEDEAIGFTVGTNLFVGYIPPEITADCVGLIESGGRPEFYLPDFTEKAVQVLSRAKDYFTARDNAYKIYNLLHGMAGVVLPVVTAGEEYCADIIEAVSEPQSLGQDEKGLFNISTNFVFKIQDK